MLNAEAAMLRLPTDSKDIGHTRNFVFVRETWPAIVQAQHSEKPAIQQKVDMIIKQIEKGCETLAFDFPVSEVRLVSSVGEI